MQLLWFCAKGYSFFVGIVLLFIAVLISLKNKPKFYLTLPIFLFSIVAVVFIYLASVPKGIWFYALWGVLFLYWFICTLINYKNKKLFVPISSLLLIVSTIAFISEIYYVVHPEFNVSEKKIYLIGDSFSAGIDSRHGKTWPNLLRDKGYNIVDLSVSGATVKSASRQLEQIKDGDCFVILEIGGNDFFQKTEYNDFEADFEFLIHELQVSNCKIIMFEIPSFPWQIKYARVQRKLADKYDIRMIPKRFFVDVISFPNASSDLAHLTPTGHQKMSTAMTEILFLE